MKRFFLLAVLSATAVVVMAGPVPAQSGTERPPADARIQRAIAEATLHLKKIQKDDGSWVEYPKWDGATTALAALALVMAGEPAESEHLQKAIKALQEYQLDTTYVVSCRAMAYAALMRHYPQLRRDLQRDVTWLVRNQHGDGMWGYHTLRENKGNADNSNTQFAVMALRDASLAGIEVPSRTWQRLHQHYTTTQFDDGGWSYRKPEIDPRTKSPIDGQAKASVTAPSLASLLIVNDELAKTLGCPCGEGRSSGGKVDAAHVEKGIDWLIDYFGGGGDHGDEDMQRWKTYFYVGVQRAGQASGLKTFGKHDWYRRSSRTMYYVAKNEPWRQYNRDTDDPRRRTLPGKPSGETQIITVIKDGEEEKRVVEPTRVVNVALATIFLIKGNAPVFMSKLKYDGDWNRHRRDLALVTEAVAKQLERPLRWQSIDIATDPSMWHDAPLLYLSGEEELNLTDEQKEQLKAYCRQGGTLLVEANCANAAFASAAESLFAELWPEWPLETLPADHPIYNCQMKIDAKGMLRGVDDGVRTFALLTTADLSCKWQMRQFAEHREAFDLAINLYAYATDKAPPPKRLSEIENVILEQQKAIQEYEEAVLQEKILARNENRKPKRIPEPEFDDDEDDEQEEIDFGDIEAGDKPTVIGNLLQHEGNHQVALHYEILGHLIGSFQREVGVTLAIGGAVPAAGASPAFTNVLLVRGDGKMNLDADARTALAGYLTGGGMVIAEASLGSKAFDEDFRAFIDETDGLELEPIGLDHLFMKGAPAEGLEGVAIEACSFSRAYHQEHPSKTSPELYAITHDGKTVGYYSPLDLLYSATGNGAYGLRGYDQRTAMAILTNMFLVTTK